METWMLPQSIPVEVRKKRTAAPGQLSGSKGPKIPRAETQMALPDAVQELLVALSRHTVGMDVKLRSQEAILMDTLALPATWPEVVAMQAAGLAYSDMVRKKGKNHGLGPPYIQEWASLIKCIHSSKDTPEGLKIMLKDHMAKAENPGLLLEAVKYCRLKMMWGGERACLQIHVAPILQSLWDNLKAYLVQRGAQQLYGPPPKGPHLRRLVKAMAALRMDQQ
jgi:hypothetical protein